MKNSPDDKYEEINALVRVLDETQQRIQELAGDELDLVIHPGGRAYLLHKAQQKLQQSEALYRSLFETMLEGYAYCQLLFEGDRAVDYVYLSVNSAFEAQTGLKNVVGRKVSEVVPGMHEANPEQLEIYSRVARTGRPEQFETYAVELDIWFFVSVCSTEPKHFVVVFENITQNKKAVEALKASEELAQQTATQLAKVLDSSLDVICTFDAKGCFTQVSAACERVWGFRPEELLGTAFIDKVHPDDREMTRAIDANILSGVSTVGFENRYLRKDGSTVDMLWSASWSEVEQSNFCVAHDITERKKAEETLQLLNSAVMQSRESILITDAELDLPGPKILFVNPAFTEITGYTSEEAIGRTPRILQGPKTDREIIKKLRENLDQGKNFRGETTNYRKDGTTYFQEWNIAPIRNKQGKVTNYVAHQRDISQRKKGEKLLLESQQRLALATESAHMGIWDWEIATDTLLWDSQMHSIYGIREEDFSGVGNAWRNSLHQEDLARAEAEIAASLQSGPGFHSEYRIFWPNGEVRYVEAHGLVVRTEEGIPLRMIGINWDVTERKKLEQQFLRAQRMEGIGTLAGGIAHDLNNMLSPIIMSIDLLKMKLEDPASQKLLSIIGASAQRGADMVGQVLTFARGVEGRRIEVDVKNLLRDLEKLAVDTFEKNIQISSIVPTDLWTVMGDPTQLHQVLLNLCVNARDAMPDGGTLTLTAENILLDAHYAALSHDAHVGSYVALQIEDTGSGMPEAVMEKIFDPFFTTKELGRGTGLGLSTTLAIVKSHGGFVRVYSELGKGTKFKVYLPGTTEKSALALAAAEAEMPRGHGELILVVDDEPSIRQVSQQTLEAFGYRVVVAADGTEALAIYALRSKEIAAVITDMMMPFMDGPAMIRVFRKINPAVRVIAASGLTPSSQLMDLGVNHFLPKPYTAQTMLKLLHQLLSDSEKD